jgi:hypothetical protein
MPKIEATIKDARIYLGFQEAGQDFSSFVWSIAGRQPIQNEGPVPSSTLITLGYLAAGVRFEPWYKPSRPKIGHAVGKNTIPYEVDRNQQGIDHIGDTFELGCESPRFVRRKYGVCAVEVCLQRPRHVLWVHFIAAKFLCPDNRLDPKLALVAFAAPVTHGIGDRLMHFVEGVEAPGMPADKVADCSNSLSRAHGLPQCTVRAWAMTYFSRAAL